MRKRLKCKKCGKKYFGRITYPYGKNGKPRANPRCCFDCETESDY
jgi:hypothetical protein